MPPKDELNSVHDQPSIEVVVETELEPHLVAADRIRSIFPTSSKPPCFLLYFGCSGVELRSPRKPKQKGYKVDFSTIDRRVGAGNLSRNQILPKAIGRSVKSVIDATGGFCTDGFRLALMGYYVTVFEQSPIVSTLVQDGFRRAQLDSDLWLAVGTRINFAEGNSLDLIPKQPPPDTIYLDPMFPPKRKKSALPSRPAQILQSLIVCNGSLKVQPLFKLAKQIAKQKVVIKRPKHAPIFSENPAHIFEGKLVRYEVYLPT